MTAKDSNGKRGSGQKLSELAAAEKAALVAVKKIRDILLAPDPDFKAASDAQKIVTRFIRLRNQQVATGSRAPHAAGAPKTPPPAEDQATQKAVPSAHKAAAPPKRAKGKKR